MALLTAQQISQSGLIPVYSVADIAAGDTLVNTGIEYFHIKNESALSITATVIPVITTVEDPLLGELTKENATLVLAAGAQGFLGPYEIDAFNSPTSTIKINYTAVTSVTIAALYI
tara:strand:- start:1027 stop:1374 length:348 start_codon:yes stop_codon:yes gene_type:complete